MEQERRPLIAVVDDDISVCRAIRRLASVWGMDTVTFNSGREFISMIEATPSFKPDCAVLDVDMPPFSGLEVQRHPAVRKRGIPVIFVTGSIDPRIRETALARGAIAVFHKPFPVDLFLMLGFFKK